MDNLLNVKEFKYRWVILFLYFVSEMSNQVVWITFAPITGIVEDAYNIEKFWVEACSLVYMIAYILVVFPSNYILDTWGLRAGMTIGALGTLLGAVLRIGGYYNFWYLLIGNTIGGMSQPFMMNAPAKVACTWFRSEMVIPKQRPIATTIASLASPIGVALGFGVPGIFVSNGASKSDIGFLMIIEAILVGAMTLPTAFFFSNKPSLPPSYAAHAEKDQFKVALKKVSTNKNFILLTVAFSVSLGTSNTLATLLQQMTEPYGYSSDTVSLLGALIILSGIFGSGLAGWFVSVTMKFKALCIAIIVSSVILIALSYPTLEFGNAYFFGVLAGLIGFCLLPIIPIGYEFACELTFPVGEAMTGGLIACAAQIVGIAQILLALLFNNHPAAIILISVVFLAAGGVAALVLKEDLKRSRKDTLNKNKIENSLDYMETKN